MLPLKYHQARSFDDLKCAMVDFELSHLIKIT